MAPRLSVETRIRLEALFPPGRRDEAERLLVERCGDNLHYRHGEVSDEIGVERVRFAALKLSGGDLRGLRRAVRLGEEDWRDLLMAAGFGEDPAAHRRWRPAGPGRVTS